MSDRISVGHWLLRHDVFNKAAILPIMQNWQHFVYPGFALGFRYPEITPQGHIAEKAETQDEERIRIHFTSKESHELYFEITKYVDLPAQAEYQDHKEYLENMPDEYVVSDLKEIRRMSQPDYEYSIKWREGARIVMLIETDDATYRVLYDPNSPLNVQVLSTIQWTY